jgi:hypothetical protein
MDGTYCSHWESRSALKMLAEKREEKRPRQRPRRRCKETWDGCDGVGRIQQAEDRAHWRAVPSMILNLRVPTMGGTSWLADLLSACPEGHFSCVSLEESLRKLEYFVFILQKSEEPG